MGGKRGGGGRNEIIPFFCDEKGNKMRWDGDCD